MGIHICSVGGNPSWSAAFSAIAELANQRRLVVVLDEFPYLVEADPELPTLLQREWDLRLQRSHLFLVLSGSIQSVIRQQVLDPSAPLYRRHTWPYELRPLTLSDLPPFFPRYSAEQLVEAYAVLGGLPYYLISVDPQIGLLTNIKRHVLSPQGSLFAEVRLQLHEELRGDIENSCVTPSFASGINGSCRTKTIWRSVVARRTLLTKFDKECRRSWRRSGRNWLVATC